MDDSKDKKPIIGITHGDINGISYEIILKALKNNRVYSNFIPVIYGSPKVAAYYKKVMNLSSINLNHIPSIDEADTDMINIINCVTNKIKVEIGKSTDMAGQASVNALKYALIDLKAGKIDALVTAPINKHNMKAADFEYTGHTDYLKAEYNAPDVLMMMLHEDIKLTVVTEHIRLSEVATSITTEKILSKLRLIKETMKKDFGMVQPKIAVLGLNPHAGDLGLMGDEEETIITPAIKQANEEGILAFGPFAPDGFFGFQKHLNFDVTLAMYHDQGLIPFKTIAKGGGVNYTAGLPIIRTSPAHGVAYDIAGKNKASAKSLTDAIYAALDILKQRKISENIQPLDTNIKEQ